MNYQELSDEQLRQELQLLQLEIPEFWRSDNLKFIEPELADLLAEFEFHKIFGGDSICETFPAHELMRNAMLIGFWAGRYPEEYYRNWYKRLQIMHVLNQRSHDQMHRELKHFKKEVK